MSEGVIAYRTWNGQTRYIAGVKQSLLDPSGKGDWSYTDRHYEAITLSANEIRCLINDHPDTTVIARSE